MLLTRVLAFVVLCLNVAAQPVISPDGVVNSAAYLPSCAPNGGVAQGSIFTIFGSGIGPAQLEQVSRFPLESSLAGTSVRVTIAGTTIDALPLYTSATQAAVLLPSRTPTGTGSVTVTYAGRTSAPVPIRVVRSSFGIYTVNQAGTGQAVIENVDGTNRVLNGVRAAASSGQLVVLWGTGLGPISGDDASGPLPNLPIENPVNVWVGGERARVLYAGRSGCCPGLDQIVFEVPAGIEGCHIPLTVEVGGVYGNYASLSVGSGGRCPDPGVESTVAPGRTAGGILLADIDFRSAGLPTIQGEFITASFERTGATLPRIQSLSDLFLGGPAGPAGTCRVLPPASRDVSLFFSRPPSGTQPLDAGSALTLRGDGGTRSVPQISRGLFEAGFEGSTLPAGTYAISNAAGGEHIGGFLFNAQLAGATWGDVPIAIPRNRDLAIQWTGDPGDGLVAVTGSAVACGNRSVTFVCYEALGAGRVTVPSHILQQLPASGLRPGSLSLAVVTPNQDRSFTAPGLDLGFFLHLNVRYRQAWYE